MIAFTPKRIICSVFVMLKTHERRLTIRWQADAAACQPADGSSSDTRFLRQRDAVDNGLAVFALRLCCFHPFVQNIVFVIFLFCRVK